VIESNSQWENPYGEGNAAKLTLQNLLFHLETWT
jgi:hypothetical protein